MIKYQAFCTSEHRSKCDKMLMLAYDKNLKQKNLSLWFDRKWKETFFVNLSSLPFQRNEVMDGRVQKIFSN